MIPSSPRVEKRKISNVVVSESEDDEIQSTEEESVSSSLSDESSASDHKRKSKKLVDEKLKVKTLDFATFISRIENLSIDYASLNFLRECQNNPSARYLLDSCKLKNHQWEGVSWLKSLLIDNDVSGILGDDMGLGKTVQVISFFCFWLEQLRGSEVKPFLIVTPLSLVENWCQEFKKFCGNNINVLRYIGDQNQRSELRETVENETELKGGQFPYHVIVTSYETIISDTKFLTKYEYKCLCVDEAHRLKNPKTVLYKTLVQLYKWEKAILMSGTPLMNNIKELWSLLRFVAPKYFDHDYDTFEGWFPQQCFLSKSTLKKVATGTQPTLTEDEVECVDVDEVKKNFQVMLKPFMLRRTKNQILKDDLPPKYEHIIYTRMTSMQKKYYKGFLMKDRSAIGKRNARGLNNILMSLRKCCNHPYLFEGAEPEPFSEGEHIVNNSGKMIVLDKLLKKLKREGHRVLIFSQMTSMLDILQDYMHFRKWNYERLDGSVRGEERWEAISNFSDSEVFAFLLSTRAGGVGLNLVAADTVIFADMDMNPQMDFQAQARCHRIGQDKPVHVYRLITESTVEEVIMNRSMKKITLSMNTVETAAAASSAFESGNDDKLSSDSILEMITFGLHKIMGGEVDDQSTDQELLNLSIDDLLKEETKSDLSMSVEDIGSAATQEQSIYLYEGVDYKQDGTKDIKKDEQALRNLLGEVGLDLPSPVSVPEGSKKTFKKKGASRKKKQVSSEDEEEFESDKSDVPVTVIQTRSSTRKRRKIQRKAASSSEEESEEEEEMESYPIVVPDEWDMEIFLMEKEFNEEDEEEPPSPISSIEFVKGDVTSPESFEKHKNRFIINVVSDYGLFPNAGISKQITAKYSKQPKKIYEQAMENDEIALGDAQLIKLTSSKKYNTYLINVIAQQYEKSKGHGPLLVDALEMALHKVAYSALNLEASIHMPRIGFGLPGFNWYAIERVLKKCLIKAGIRTLVYYFQRHQPTSTNKPSTPVKKQNTTPSKSDTSTPVKASPQTTPKSITTSTDSAKDDALEDMNIYIFGKELQADKKLRRSITLNGGVIMPDLTSKNIHMIIVAHSNQLSGDDDEIDDQETTLAKDYIRLHPGCSIVLHTDLLASLQ